MLHLASGLHCNSQHREITPAWTLRNWIHQLQAHFWWAHNFTVAPESLPPPPQLSLPVQPLFPPPLVYYPSRNTTWRTASSTVRALRRTWHCRQVDRELPEFLFPSLTLQWRAFTSPMHYLPSTAIGHVLIPASWFRLAGSKGRFEVFLPKSSPNLPKSGWAEPWRAPPPPPPPPCSLQLRLCAGQGCTETGVSHMQVRVEW